MRRAVGSTPRQVNFAAKDRVVFNGQPQGVHIALHNTARAQIDAARGDNISLDAAHDQDVLGGKVGGHMRVWANRKPVLGQIDKPFDVPIDDEILTSLYFPANHNRLANACLTVFGSHVEFLPGIFFSASQPDWESNRVPSQNDSCTKYMVVLARLLRFLQMPGALPALYANGPLAFNSRNRRARSVSNSVCATIPWPGLQMRTERLLAGSLLLTALITFPCRAESSPGQAPQIVERALAAELRAAQDTSHPMRYDLRRSSPRLTTTKEICETKDGSVARLVALNDRPLTPTEEQREEARLDGLLSDPSRQRHRKQSEDADTERVLKILRALPNAFLYRPEGTVPGPAGTLEHFSFRPNPRFDPPNLETLALTEMEGELWIDTAQGRVARLEGHLIQDVNFGWGILGQLDKGGWIRVEQANAGGGQWRITHFQMEMAGRVVLKNKVFRSDQWQTEFTPVPADLTYQQAIQMLRADPGRTSAQSR